MTATFGRKPTELANTLIPYTYASLGMMPVYSDISPGLTMTLAAVGGSWWLLDPASWPTPPAGRSLQYRFHAQMSGLTNGDVVGMQPYNNTDSAGLGTESTATADATAVAEVLGPWTNFPASRKSGYIMVRNQTAARGVSNVGFIEVAIR